MTWISTNISERIENPNTDFKCFINKTEFETVSFDVAADNVAKYLASLNKKLFVSFSGGYDSEFIVRRLHSLKIPFTPIILKYETFSYEREYAYKTLRELNIDAVVLKVSMNDYISYYYEYVHKKINSMNTTPSVFIAKDYVDKERGILIDGTHLGGFTTYPWWRIRPLQKDCLEDYIFKKDNTTDGGISFNYIKDQIFYQREYDSYGFLYPETVYHFFMLTPQIVVSMLDAIESTDLNWNDYKERLYKLRWRPKLGLYYRQNFIGFNEDHYENLTSNKKTIEILKNKDIIDASRKYKPKDIHYFGTKNDLRNLIVKEN